MRINVKDDDRKWRKILAQLREPGKDAFVSIGLHSDAEPYERGQEAPANVAQIASFHEFGTAKMPARPFLGPTADTQRDAWGTILDRAFALVLKDKLTMRQAFAVMGEQAAADVKKAITDLDSPPLAESTIAKKVAKSLGTFASYARKSGLRGEDAAADTERRAQAYTEAGAQPLIDSGHMRASVTYKVQLSGVVTGSKADADKAEG